MLWLIPGSKSGAQTNDECSKTSLSRYIALSIGSSRPGSYFAIGDCGNLYRRDFALSRSCPTLARGGWVQL